MTPEKRTHLPVTTMTLPKKGFTCHYRDTPEKRTHLPINTVTHVLSITSVTHSHLPISTMTHVLSITLTYMVHYCDSCHGNGILGMENPWCHDSAVTIIMGFHTTEYITVTYRHGNDLKNSNHPALQVQAPVVSSHTTPSLLHSHSAKTKFFTLKYGEKNKIILIMSL